MAKLPQTNLKHKICVICEGHEDYKYFMRLCDLAVWSRKYDFHPINAKSASNIPAVYENEYQNDRYEMILIFCDTDKCPYKQYKQIKNGIDGFLGIESVSKEIIIFANPCTMQIILLHFGEVNLKNQGKGTNAPIIEKLTGVKNYDAHESQIDEICKQIFHRTYRDMRSRVSKINHEDTVSGSTNFIEFLDRFESDKSDWIAEINKKLIQK